MTERPDMHNMTDEQVAELVEPYALRWRRLPDGTVAFIGQLMTTRAIHLGVSGSLYDHWRRRFCFQDYRKVEAEFDKLTAWTDTPEGWVARRPEGEQ